MGPCQESNINWFHNISMQDWMLVMNVSFELWNIIFSVFKWIEKSWFIPISSPAVNPKGRNSEGSKEILLDKSYKLMLLRIHYLIVFRRLRLRCAHASLKLRSKILKKNKSYIRGPAVRTNIFNNHSLSIYYFKDLRIKIIKSPSLPILDFLTYWLTSQSYPFLKYKILIELNYSFPTIWSTM